MEDCPDLALMTSTQRSLFWASHDPRRLRGLGDRLLAESLPRPGEPNHRTILSQLSRERRLVGEWSRSKLALLLGVSDCLLQAWERDQVRTPDSLPLILDRLVTLQVCPE